MTLRGLIRPHADDDRIPVYLSFSINIISIIFTDDSMFNSRILSYVFIFLLFLI